METELGGVEGEANIIKIYLQNSQITNGGGGHQAASYFFFKQVLLVEA